MTLKPITRTPTTEEQLERAREELKDARARIERLSTTTTEQRRELDTIHSSIAFRMVRKYWQAREAVLPPGTRAGAAYQAAKRIFDGRIRKLEPGTRPARDSDRAPTSIWDRPLTGVSAPGRGTRVLIVAELSIPQCKRYRVDQKAEMFRRLGFETTVITWTDAVACRNELQLSALAVFYRVPAVPAVIELIDEARRLGIASFFDIDDLVFDEEEYQHNSNLLTLSKREREELLEGARLYGEALTRCDHAIASTATLARRMRNRARGETLVVENGLDDAVLEIAQQVRRRPPARNPGLVTIGYGSGTRTHDADFSVAADALLEVLLRHPEVRLAIHGFLQLPESFKQVSDQVVRIPFLAADDYLRAVASWDISIAPLESTVFNDAKSNIKFLEAAVFGVPTVCSPAAAFKDQVEHGRSGFIASTTAEWVTALETLIADVQLRARIGAEAERCVLERYNLDTIAREQLSAVVRHVVPPARRGLRVLEVNVLFAPQSFGGATIVAEKLSQKLAAQDCQVTVFTGVLDSGRPPYSLVRYETDGLPVVAVQLPPADRVLEYENPEMAALFDKVLAAVDPDVVHFHSIQNLSAAMTRACRLRAVPYVVTLHDAWWLCERQFMVRPDGTYCFQRQIDLRECAKCVPDPAFTSKRTYALRDSLDGASLLLTPSEFQRQLYLANGVATDRIAVNKNGILLPRSATPKRVGPRLRFAYLGGRAAHKGYYWLQEVFAGIRESNYELVMTDIQRRLGTPSISADEWDARGKVEVIPPYDQEDLDEFFSSIDVLLMPSNWKESFGLAVREALVRNVWVISTDSGGVTEDIVEGVNGNVVPIGDVTGFRNAVVELLRSPARLDGYENPLRSRVRGFDEQARELRELLDAVARPDEVQAPVPIRAGIR